MPVPCHQAVREGRPGIHLGKADSILLEILQAFKHSPKVLVCHGRRPSHLTIVLMTIELEAGKHEKNSKQFSVVQVIHDTFPPAVEMEKRNED